MKRTTREPMQTVAVSLLNENLDFRKRVAELEAEVAQVQGAHYQTIIDTAKARFELETALDAATKELAVAEKAFVEIDRECSIYARVLCRGGLEKLGVTFEQRAQ